MTAIDDILVVGLTAGTFFGKNRKRARNKYMRYMRLIHPDIVDDDRASQATARLNVMWEEYTSRDRKEPHNVGTNHYHHTHMVVRDENMAIILDTDSHQWMMVNRHPGIPLSIDDAVEALMDNMISMSASSPLTMLKPEERISIPQSDGMHMAYRVRYPGDGDAYGLSVLMERLGSHHALLGEDVAWIFKRILFLAGILDHESIHLNDSDAFLSRCIVYPSSHEIVVMDYTGMRVADDVDNVRALSTSLYALLLHYHESIPETVMSFIHGCMVNHKPSAGELMKDFDDVLLDTFGAPRFHKMVIV